MNRREFLRHTAVGAASTLLPFPAAAGHNPLWEGIYTDRQTYLSGIDSVDVHLSLLDVTSVTVTVLHIDHAPSISAVGSFAVTVDGTQMPEYPGYPSGGAGIFGPQFPVRISLDTSNWEPGLYSVTIPASAIRPENRQNISGSGFVSQNHHAYFVVTAAVPTSYSNILWVHDCALGVAYGAFGGESIYGGPNASGVNTVSTQRPGLDRGNTALAIRDYIVKLKGDDYEFEYIDSIAFGLLAEVPAYDLIVVCGQFEYVSHGFMTNLSAHTAAGRNLLIAAHEFAVFRTRIDAAATSLTTYKISAPLDDPISGVEQAGVGMHVSDSIYETEIAGMNTWSAWNIGFSDQDMSITNTSDTGWIFEGTGFVDTLPGYVNGFCNGNRGLHVGSNFSLIDTAISRTPSDTVVFAATPSTGARKWDEAVPGQPNYLWPPDPDGFALCTWRETNEGARVIGLPQAASLTKFSETAGYERMLENIFEYLVTPGTPSAPTVPSLTPLSVGVLSAALAGAAKVSSAAIKATAGSRNRDE